MKKNTQKFLNKPILFSSKNESKGVVPIKRLDEFPLSNKPTLIISKEVQTQIMYFHNRTGKKEWSGFLLFDQQGDLTDINSMVLTTKHIHLLDIGSETFTSISDYDPFEITDDIGDRGFDYKMGIVHTHHTMNTFFSGTDTGCLHDNAANYPFLLSLIVNFEGDYKAKIAFIGKESESNKKLTLNERLSNLILDLGKSKSKDVLITCDCTIVLEQEDYVTKRYDKLLAKKKEAEERFASTRSYNYSNYNNYGNSRYSDHNYWNTWNTDPFEKYPNKNQKTLFDDKPEYLDLSLNSLDNLMAKVIFVDPKMTSQSMYYTVKKGNDRYLEIKNDSEKELYLDYVEDNFGNMCDQHFNKMCTPEEISKIAHRCIVRLKVFKDIPFVNNLVEMLESYDLEMDDFLMD